MPMWYTCSNKHSRVYSDTGSYRRNTVYLFIIKSKEIENKIKRMNVGKEETTKNV